MNTNVLTGGLLEHLADAGYKSAVVSIDHLSDFQDDLKHLLEDGFLERDFYDEIVRRYDLDFHFEPPEAFQEAQSIIITVAPQPKVSVAFTISGKVCSALVPSTYIHDSDLMVRKIISHYLEQGSFRIQNAILPEKTLAVHCGLARYGKNNVAYIDGLGSYFRLSVFFSDLPCTSDTWQELKMMDHCETCSVCLKRCPTKAIKEDRFLIDGGRCLTYFNEGDEDFPEWIDPSWHNCLIGCMICQDVCPLNKDHTQWIIDGEEFSEEETRMILGGTHEQNLPRETVAKLQRLYMWEYYRLLKRNLKVLFKIQSKNSKNHTLE